MSNQITPIFLISLPRSGSTFLQKILMTHPRIASTAEPWILLPLCYMSRKDSLRAPYGHNAAVNAFNRITSECGEDYVSEAMASFVRSIYRRYCTGDQDFFLDKTPRYYFILSELGRLFPHGKFVVLLRNPISVFASAIEALKRDSIRRLDSLEHDLYTGPRYIADFVQHTHVSHHVLTYEKLVSEPEKSVRSICESIGVSYREEMIERSFGLRLVGHGDHLGAQTYTSVVSSPGKWKETIDNTYRRMRLLSFVKKFSEEYLRIGGYDRNQLLASVVAHKPRSIGIREWPFWLEEKAIKAYKKPFARHDADT